MLLRTQSVDFHRIMVERGGLIPDGQGNLHILVFGEIVRGRRGIGQRINLSEHFRREFGGSNLHRLLKTDDLIEFLFLFLGRADFIVGRAEGQVVGIEGLARPGCLFFLQEVSQVVQGALFTVAVFFTSSLMELAQPSFEFVHLGAVIGYHLPVALSDFFWEAVGVKVLPDRLEIGFSLMFLLTKLIGLLEQALLVIVTFFAPLGFGFHAQCGGAKFIQEISFRHGGGHYLGCFCGLCGCNSRLQNHEREGDQHQGGYAAHEGGETAQAVN